MGQYSDLLFKTQAAPSEQPKTYSDMLLGAAAAPDAAPTGAEPDAATWLGRRQQDIVGKRDPRYADMPDLRDALLEEGSTDVTRPMALSSVLNASDAQLGDIAKNALGDRFISTEKDANDYDVVRYKGKDGQPKVAYINRPGLDVNDIGRAATGALPFLAVGGGVGTLAKAATPLIRGAAQAAGAGATSMVADVAQVPLGSEQGVDLPKAGMIAATAGAAEPLVSGLSAIAREIVTIPGLFNKTTGQLTPKGAAAAQSAGLDAAALNAEASKVFAKTYAMAPDAATAATRATVEPFGIPTTKGQVSKDPFLLTQEEGMRRRLYGENAQDVMRAFDVEQSQAVREAALGSKPQSVTAAISPGRRPASAPQDSNPMVLGQSVREGANTAREAARAAEGEAWDKVGPLTATKDALDVLPASLEARLGADVIVDSETTPAAAKMAQEMDRFVSGEAPQPVAKVLKNNPVQSVDLMRRRLLSISRGAQTPSDKRAAVALYDGFNDWIDEAASKNLLAGDASAAAQLKVARGFTKDVRDLFEPSAAGRSTPAGRRLAAVMETADSPEGVINQLLGSSGSRGVDQGTTQALTHLKQALDRFAPKDVAKSAWDDVRLAYWVRQVQGRNGEMLGPTAIMNNVKAALSNQQSVVRALYTPEEERLIRQFAQAMEKISFKPPNASGSGYTAASFIKEGVMKLFEAFGLRSKIGQAVLEYSGVGNAYGTAAAKAAVNQAVRASPSNLGPAATAAAATYDRNRTRQ
jgi:hypothetical protein